MQRLDGRRTVADVQSIQIEVVGEEMHIGDVISGLAVSGSTVFSAPRDANQAWQGSSLGSPAATKLATDSYCI